MLLCAEEERDRTLSNIDEIKEKAYISRLLNQTWKIF